MKHPFQVGGKYRNRKGVYEVVELDGPRMVIRYRDGTTLQTSVELQERILVNIQAERIARRRQAAEKAVKKQSASSGRIRFDGLVDSDFQQGTAGTTWRARTGLGGLLAERLSARTNQPFESHAVFRRAEVHIAQAKHYSKKMSLRQAKFVFALDLDCARYGLYIEKNDGPMDESWHWPNLMAALAADKALQEETLAAMRRLGLRWEIYTYPGEGATLVTAGADGLQCQPEGGEAEAITWGDFLQRLENVSEDAWCDLYLRTHMDKEQAIAASAGIAGSAVEVYRALLPLYKAATRSSNP